jgi:hypothetical protein
MGRCRPDPKCKAPPHGFDAKYTAVFLVAPGLSEAPYVPILADRRRPFDGSCTAPFDVHLKPGPTAADGSNQVRGGIRMTDKTMQL